MKKRRLGRAEQQRIRQRTLRRVDAESLSRAQVLRARERDAADRTRLCESCEQADVVDATRSGFRLSISAPPQLNLNNNLTIANEKSKEVK